MSVWVKTGSVFVNEHFLLAVTAFSIIYINGLYLLKETNTRMPTQRMPTDKK